ncbi:MAG: FkbM family methyltransferase [Pseudomonadota bacterium]
MDTNQKPDAKLQLYWHPNGSRAPSEVVLRHEHAVHPFVLRNHSTDVPTFHQIFVNREYNFRVHSRPAVIVDAGANIGLTAIYFASKYPNAKILALEPEPSNYQLLVKNSGPYPNIIPIQAAVWDQSGEIDLVDPGSGHWAFRTQRDDLSAGAAYSPTHKIPSLCVPDLMAAYDLNAIDIFKIDIEGAEKEVFNDTAEWINSVRSIIIELHDRFRPGCARSFYNGSNGFDTEWRRGENIFLSRDGYLRESNR